MNPADWSNPAKWADPVNQMVNPLNPLNPNGVYQQGDSGGDLPVWLGVALILLLLVVLGMLGYVWWDAYRNY